MKWMILCACFCLTGEFLPRWAFSLEKSNNREHSSHLAWASFVVAMLKNINVNSTKLNDQPSGKMLAGRLLNTTAQAPYFYGNRVSFANLPELEKIMLAEDPTTPKQPDEATLDKLSFSKKRLELKWIEQPLDHFNIFDNRTWKMRYVVNDKFFKPGGPLFIEIGGEAMMEGNFIIVGQTPRLAEKYHGMMVETEHRYYGKSLPFGKNFSTPNLRWLTADQGLEDLAQFIEQFKSITPGLNNSKVVVRGCSYPGMLSTWIRIKYPHLVDISYASSAPIRVDLEYPAYFEVVNDVYANVSKKCIDTIREGFKELKELLTTKEGRRQVRATFKEFNCLDVYEMTSSDIMEYARGQMNTQNDIMEYEQLMCLTLMLNQADTTAFERLARMLKTKAADECPNPSEAPAEEEGGDSKTEEKEGMIEKKESEVDYKDLIDKAWSYQCCTEQAAYQTLSKANPKHPFEVDSTLEAFFESCQEEFGPGFDEALLKRSVDSINRRYGGTKPKMTKVLSIQGRNDPWRELGLLESLGPDAPVILMDGSHCPDYADFENLDYPDDSVSPALRAGNKQARDIISKWLDEIL